MTTLRRTLEVGRNLATGIAIGAAFFLVVEGLFSSWAALESIFPQNRLAESLHTWRVRRVVLADDAAFNETCVLLCAHEAHVEDLTADCHS